MKHFKEVLSKGPEKKEKKNLDQESTKKTHERRRK